MDNAVDATVFFSDDIWRFAVSTPWTFARTMTAWPHQHVVHVIRERVDEALFPKATIVPLQVIVTE